MSEVGQVGFVLDKKLAWSEGENNQLFDNITICTVLGPLGIAIGSQLGGIMMARVGLWNLLACCNLL